MLVYKAENAFVEKQISIIYLTIHILHQLLTNLTTSLRKNNKCTTALINLSLPFVYFKFCLKLLLPLTFCIALSFILHITSKLVLLSRVLKM